MGECQLRKEGSGLIDVVFIAAKMKSRQVFRHNIGGIWVLSSSDLIRADPTNNNSSHSDTHNNILGDILRTKEENKNMVYIQPWMARVSVQ